MFKWLQRLIFSKKDTLIKQQDDVIKSLSWRLEAAEQAKKKTVDWAENKVREIRLETSEKIETMAKERDFAIANSQNLEEDVRIYNIKPGDLVIFRHSRPNNQLIEQNSFGFGLTAVHTLKDKLCQLAGGPVMVIGHTKDFDLDVTKLSYSDRVGLRNELDKADAVLSSAPNAPLSDSEYNNKFQRTLVEALRLQNSKEIPPVVSDRVKHAVDDLLEIKKLLDETE